MPKYLLVEKYRDYPVCDPVRLLADNGYDAHEEAFKRFETVRPDKVEFFKLYELSEDGELTKRGTFATELTPGLRVIDTEELEDLLQPVGTL
jgi:hypothetical protein